MIGQVCLAVSAEQIQHLDKIKMSIFYFFFKFMIIERKLQGFRIHRHHLDPNKKKKLDSDCSQVILPWQQGRGSKIQTHQLLV